MRYVVLGLGLLLVLTIAWCATRKPLSLDEELKKLTPSDRSALDTLLTEAGLTAAQLTPIGLGSVEHAPLNRHTRAIAIENDRVAALRLVDVPIKQLDALKALTGLRALSLAGNQITSLAAVRELRALELLDVSRNQIRDLSPLASLPALRILRLADNGLQTLNGLSGLNALVEIDLSQNQITEIAPLVAFSNLRRLDISKNPIKNLPTPLPDRWTMKQDAAQTADAQKASRPTNWTPQLPPRKGKMAKVKMVSGDPAGTWNGTIATLEGAEIIWPLIGSTTHTGERTLELTVDKGRVRAYLIYYPKSGSLVTAPDGFVFAEAEPGKPGSATGELQNLTGSPPHNINERPWEYQLLVESLDGEAQGIHFQFKR